MRAGGESEESGYKRNWNWNSGEFVVVYMTEYI